MPPTYYSTPGFGSGPNGNQIFGVDATTGVIEPYTDNSGTGLGTQTYRFPINGYLPATVLCGLKTGTALASSVAETDILGTAVGGSKTIAASALSAIGRSLSFEFVGIIANTSTPNITFKLALGSTTILTTGAVATAAISGTSAFRFSGQISCVTAGATGTVNGAGFVLYSLDKSIAAPPVSGAAVTVDLTAAQQVKCLATWGTSSASNTLTCTGGKIWLDTIND